MTEKYFKSLNYSLGNEDTTLEVRMVEELKPKRVLAVAGSGGRSLPLLCHGPSDLYCVDLSKEQIHLTELRAAGYKDLSFDEYILFWGYPPYEPNENGQKRKDLFNKMTLSENCKSFFTKLYEQIDWASPLYLGKWEKTFQVVASVVKKILGKSYDRIFQFDKLEDQIKYYENDFPLLRWKFILFVMGNKSFFNALLYKGNFIEKNIPESHFQHYFNNFDSMYRNVLSRESFFMQLIFLGQVRTPEGIPIEADENIFHNVKKTLQEGNGKVHLEEKNIFSLVKEINDIDFFSFSDVPSYFTGETEKNFLQEVRPCLSEGGVVVLRYYLRICEADEQGYEDVTDSYKELIRKEKVQMYKVKVLKKV